MGPRDRERLALAVHASLASLRQVIDRPSTADMERDAARVASDVFGVPARATIDANGVLTLTLEARPTQATLNMPVRVSL